MSKWIDVPAHRVLEVSKDELAADFYFVNDRVVRKNDKKLFRYPQFRFDSRDFGRIYYLEEVEAEGET
jgi:hypothetical protein